MIACDRCVEKKEGVVYIKPRRVDDLLPDVERDSTVLCDSCAGELDQFLRGDR